MDQQINDLPIDEISSKIKFSDVAKLMEKISVATTSSKKIEKLEKFFKDFQVFQRQQSSGKGNSIFPILRLFVSSVDRERPSYGIQQATMGKLFIKMLGISPKSEDAVTLMTTKTPYSAIISTVLKKRLKEVGDNLTVFEVNNKLDSIADSYQNNNRPKIDEILTELMMKMSAVDQKWLIAIILKEKLLTTKQVLQCYHPKANDLYNHFSSLSKVTEILESGENIDEVLTKTVIEPLFHVQSQLCQRILMSSVDEVLSQNDFYSETKMDGERFQLHIKDGEFKYFSRNGYDFSKSYGVSRHEGSLSPSINSLFLMDVRNIILDGEMMIWNKSKQVYHTKGENVSDVKKLNPNDPSIRPCFVVYDLLFLNDDLLINKPYAERVRILTKLFREQAGVMVLCERHKITDRDDLLVQFNKAMDNKEEGLVIKTLDSFYKPGVRAGSGWYKMKADYINGIVSDFDMLIIGGFYNEKGAGQYIESYLLGVYKKTDTENKFLSVATVLEGLDRNERSNLNASLRPHWQKTKTTKVGRKTVYESPSFLEWNDSPPDVWIEPKNSIILEVIASELVKTNTYRTNYTMRFPRITNIRSDKQWFDCCTLEEFDGLCTSDTIVQKIDKRHLTTDDLNKPAKRTRLQKKTELLRLPIKAVLCKEDIVKLDNLLDGKNICVMTSGKNYPSIEELEILVLEHGGNIVKNPGPTTFAVIVGDISFRVKTIVNSNKYNFVRIDWLTRALEGGKKSLDEFTPHDVIAGKPELFEEFQDKFDEFGDSFTEPIDEERLKTIMTKMTDLPYQILKTEMYKLEKSLNFQFNIFRLIFGYFFGEDNTESIEQLALRLRGGTVIENIKESYQITHVFVNPENLDINRLNEFVSQLNLKNVKILSNNWIFKCNELNTLCEEDEFIVKL